MTTPWTGWNWRVGVKQPIPKGVKPVRRKLATGEHRTYWYHRATGERLASEPFTAAWFVEIDHLDTRVAKIAVATSEAGTYASMWQAYRASTQWTSLKPRTRSDYQAVRDWIGPAADKMIVRCVTEEQVRRLMDKAARERGRRFANYLRSVLRLTFEWGGSRGFLGQGAKKLPNPVAAVKPIKRPRGARKVNRAWTVDEVAHFIERAPFQLRVPFMLGLFAGMRQGDALSVPWQAFDGSRLSWIASKNGEACEAPVRGIFLQTLERARDEAKARKTVRTEIALNRWGEPWSESGFRASFFKLIRALTAEGLLKPGATFHGLRYTVVSQALDDGASDFRAAASIGDRSTEMVRLYGQDARRLRAQSDVLGDLQKRIENKLSENGSGKRQGES